MKVSPALCLACHSFAEMSHEWDSRSESAADGRGGTLRLGTAGRGPAPSRPRTFPAPHGRRAGAPRRTAQAAEVKRDYC